jgi:hypothetical protein
VDLRLLSMAAPAPDPVWGLQGDLMERLTYLAALPPPAPDGCPNQDLGSTTGYIDTLRAYAMQHVDRELLEERRDIWAKEPGDHREPWMYLKGSSEEAHKHFHGWVKLIKEDLKCDDRACQKFVELFKMAPAAAPHGFMEACRILAHALKDKNKSLEDYKEPRDDWSRFMQRASEEAIDALKDPAHLKDLRQYHGGYKGFGKMHAGPPGPDVSSSSSNSWEAPGDKGPGGKGHYMQKGYRG